MLQFSGPTASSQTVVMIYPASLQRVCCMVVDSFQLPVTSRWKIVQLAAVVNIALACVTCFTLNAGDRQQ
jgi:hypothetical protein